MPWVSVSALVPRISVGGFQSDQVKLASIQKLPLDLIPGFQTDGSRDGQGKAHIKSWGLPLGANGLDAQRVSQWHDFFPPVEWFLVGFIEARL
jgi:hypothetical protein